MPTVLQQCNYLLLKLNLSEQTASKNNLKNLQDELLRQKINLEYVQKQVEQCEKDGIAEEEIRKTFEEQYDFAVKTLFSELTMQLHHVIEENNLEGVAALLEIGRNLFKKGLDINAIDIIYGTPLCHAFRNNQLDIARLLLENGAKPNFSKHGVFLINIPKNQQSILYLAIQEKKPEFVRLLLQYNAPIDTYPHQEKSPLDHAIELGDRPIVEILVNHGADLHVKSAGIPIGPTSDFKSPLRYALECKQNDIAQFLFDFIKKDPELYRDSLNIFLHYAPLELLQNFVHDPSLSIQSKLTTSVVTKIDALGLLSGPQRRSSGEILLLSLLKNSDNEQERLLLLKEVTQQLMTIDYLVSTVEQEPCYANKELLEQLAEGASSHPIKELAQQLLHSIQADLQQGQVAIGMRVLLEILSSALNARWDFPPGIQFIKKVLTYLYNKKQCWHDIETVNNLIEKASEEVELFVYPSMKVTPSITAHRFGSMVGSALFRKFNPNLAAGGKPEEASQWHREIVSILVNTLAEEGILSEDWNEAEAQRLLTAICAKDHSHIFAEKHTKALGFKLDVPKHFIPSCLYEEQNNWVYTVMCRTMIQPSCNQKRGAVNFIIPKHEFAALRIPLIQEVLKHRGFPEEISAASQAREIQYRLLTHFLAVEQLTGTRCVYSEFNTQKSYKTPTCFSSNVKMILPVMLRILVNPATTPEQWSKFHNRIQERILVEMDKAKVSFESSEQVCKIPSEKTMAPEYIAYKLLTTLMRWIEINHFDPANEAESAGKKATVKHVLKHTKHRLQLHSFFRNSVNGVAFPHKVTADPIDLECNNSGPH